MLKLSAYIIAYNEADKIADAINSVLWADEIVVADSSSIDGTDRIAREMGARVVQIPFEGFGQLRNRAVDACVVKRFLQIPELPIPLLSCDAFVSRLVAV